jgi:16S rRNA (cytidine1402-2'-O)-methyltransferase
MLYLIATPIGNLGDITLRALETLRSVDFVASEDTRKTGFLLNHFEIKKPQISFHEYNEQRALPRMLHLLASGKSIALVTDAGTPGISDPGFVLVRGALQAGHQVTAIPGPAALILALTLSGLPVHSFTFRGFPPRKTGARQRFMAVDLTSPHTLIFYESPYRLIPFLKAAIANDLTKMFETILRGSLLELITQLETNADLRGEFTVVIAGASGELEPADQD